MSRQKGKYRVPVVGGFLMYLRKSRDHCGWSRLSKRRGVKAEIKELGFCRMRWGVTGVFELRSDPI